MAVPIVLPGGTASGGAGPIVYRAPRGPVVLFYALLGAWTIGCVPLALGRSSAGSGLLTLMIFFFAVYSWYWALGIASVVRLGENGNLEFRSARRRVTMHGREMDWVEGPPLRFGFGFLKFQGPQERVYAFYGATTELRRMLWGLKAANKELRLRRLSPTLVPDDGA